jgi:hypothetical protein
VPFNLLGKRRKQLCAVTTDAYIEEGSPLPREMRLDARAALEALQSSSPEQEVSEALKKPRTLKKRATKAVRKVKATETPVEDEPEKERHLANLPKPKLPVWNKQALVKRLIKKDLIQLRL